MGRYRSDERRRRFCISRRVPAPFVKSLFPALLVILLILASCSGSGGGSGNNSDQNAGGEQNSLSLNLATLFSTASSITIHVAYEPGAEPLAGTMQNGTPYWSIFESNIDALFLGRVLQPRVEVPMSLGGMTEMPEQAHAEWTLKEILDLAGQELDIPQTATTADFIVLFLNGNFNNQEKVIGISIGGTPVIAVFKDVIISSGYPTIVETFIEQVTLVHEFGHCVGLVDNGIPMVADHEDPDHPHHCSNQECVMFWENDSVSILTFIEKIRTSDSSVVFGQECLDDSRSFQP